MPDYRVAGNLKWISQSGNAALAFVNVAGSNKKISLTSLELYPQIRTQTVQQQVILALARCASVGDGLALAPVKHDTSSGSLPSQVKLWAGGAYNTPEVLRRVSVQKQYTGALALARLATHDNWGKGRRLRGGGVFSGRDGTVEDVVIRAGESVALYPVSVDVGLPLRVDAEFANGSVTYRTQHIVAACSESNALWALDNGSGSGVTLTLKRLLITELGEVTTPFFQLVPVAVVSPERQTDAESLFTPLQMDTNDPALGTSVARVVQDAPCNPASGIPEQYLSDASAGSPKGLNYLQTKDFLGPAYRVQFPEVSAYGVGTLPSRGFAGQSLKKHRMVDPFAPIVMRPGESVALVSSAELATGTAPVSISGHMPFEFAATLRVEDLITPTVTFTGLPTGAKVCLVEAGTETLVTTLSESGGTATYSGFTASPGTYFDARILAPGYVFQQIDDIEKLAEVQTYPISMEADLVYDSGLSEAVTFDGATKRIICDTGNTGLDVPATYSEWVDWALTGDNLRYYHAFETQGGADIDPGEGTSIPKYVYLVNLWRVRPQEANHTLSVTDGVLLVSGGGDPFVNTLSAYTVRINYQQPVQAIGVSTGATVAPTQQQIRDAMTLATSETPAAGSIDTKIAAVETDTQDIQGRLPATLSGGRMRSQVESVDADAVNASALAADAVAEIQSGLATTGDVALVLSDTADIQSRLPAALVGGKMDAALSSSERDAIADAMLDLAAAVDGATLRQVLRLLAAAAGGESSGGASDDAIESIDGVKTRITSTIDANGHRSSVSLDLT